MADLVQIIRDKNGGASSIVSGPEYQELQSLASQTDFETFKAFGLGAPSEGDKGLAEGVRGGVNIASFIKDPSVGFEAYARGLEAKLNTEATGLGLDKPIKFERVEAVKAKERSQFQNLDVYDPPTLFDKSVDIEIRKRDAVRAIETIPALARQSDADQIVRMAKSNADRFEHGLITRAQANGAQKELRRAYQKTGGVIDPLARLTSRFTGEMKGGVRPESEIDAEMGVDLSKISAGTE